MGALWELHQYCQQQEARGRKVVTTAYVLDMLERHQSEYTPRTDTIDARMIDKPSSMLERVTSKNRSR